MLHEGKFIYEGTTLEIYVIVIISGSVCGLFFAHCRQFEINISTLDEPLTVNDWIT